MAKVNGYSRNQAALSILEETLKFSIVPNTLVSVDRNPCGLRPLNSDR